MNSVGLLRFNSWDVKLTFTEAIMERLSIRQASEQFGISRARLYSLLNKGAVEGYLAPRNGSKANSWIDGDSLNTHIKTRDERLYQGRPKAKPDGDYLPVRVAAQKAGYTTRHVNYLVKMGSITAKKAKGGILVYYPSLLKYKEK
ncbi:MAG: hypothetical protein ABFS56_10675 [Pseudomonadota bacterium]